MHAADGYARATGRMRRRARDERPGRDQHRHRHRERVHGLDPDGGLHRPGRARRSSAPTRSRSPTSRASRCRSPSTTTWSRTRRDLPEVIKEAFHIASTGRPGPVLIDIPVDVSKGEIDFEYPETVNLPGYKPTYQGPQQADQAGRVDSSPKARRPLLYAGGGVLASGASKELKELAELMQLPVVTTLMGKGAFPEDHHLWIGMPGMHGAKYTNYTITETDLLIAVGVRFDDRVTGKLSAFASKAKVIHVDIDPAEIGKNKAVDVPIVGDAKTVARRARRRAAQDRRRAQDRGVGATRSTTGASSSRCTTRADEEIHAPAVRRAGASTELTKDREARHLHRGRPEPDVGVPVHTPHRAAHAGSPRAAWARWASAARRPSARRLGRPDHLVIDIAGDGSIQMNSQEMATATINDLPGQGRRPQQRLPRAWCASGRSCSTASATRRRVLAQDCPDFVKLAEAYGWHAACASPTRPSSTPRSQRRSTTTARRSSTAVSRARSACTRWSRRAARSTRCSAVCRSARYPRCSTTSLLEEVWE